MLHVPPCQILSHLSQQVQDFLERGVRYIVIGALLPRRFLQRATRVRYTRRMRYINGELRDMDLAHAYVHFLQLRGFSDHFLQVDGVHLTAEGQRWYVTGVINYIGRQF